MELLQRLGSVSDRTWTTLAAVLFVGSALLAVGSVYRADFGPSIAENPNSNVNGEILPAADAFAILSQGVTGKAANGESGATAISANGKFVAFESNAPDLVQNDTNAAFDIFVLDIDQSVLTRVGIDSNQSDGSSRKPAISANGKVIVFESTATNLVKADSNSASDVFAFDRTTGDFTRVSVSSDGTEGDGGSFGASVSDDGRYIAYSSNATNLVVNDINAAPDVFLHDRQTGITTRVSVNSEGEAPLDRSNPSAEPAISANGQVVAFTSYSTVLVDLDTKGMANIYGRDLITNATTLLSIGFDGSPANGESSQPSISADGRYVSFSSRASNLVTGDDNELSDIFLRDQKLGITHNLSMGAGKYPSDGFSAESHISADGSVVVFSSQASNLAAGDTNRLDDIYIHETASGITRRVGSVEGNGRSVNPVVSANATHIAFTSYASNLSVKDTNELSDVYLAAVK